MASPKRTPRKPLHERSSSQTNTLPAVRLVPYTPPRLENNVHDVYSRTPLPTSSAHIFPPTSSNIFYHRDGRDQDQGYETALKLSDDDVSHCLVPAKSQTSLGSAPSTPRQPATPGFSKPVSANFTKAKPLKKRKHVAVDPRTKTFKVLEIDQEEEASESTAGLRSPASVASLTSYRSHEQLSLDDSHDIDQADPSISCISESTVATSTSSTPTSKTAAISDDNITTPAISNNTSPWNYTLVGGLRKVPKTPDLKQKAAEAIEESPPPPIPHPDFSNTDFNLSSKPSFQSQITVSTSSDNTNYKIHGDSSPSSKYPVIPPLSTSDSNEELPPISSLPPSRDRSYSLSEAPYPPSDGTSDQNYQIHSGSSPANSLVALPQLKSEYSQESLIVAPLQPRHQDIGERLQSFRTYSKETLRTRAGSLASISTVLSQREASQAIVGSGSIINLPTALRTSLVWAGSGGLNLPRGLMQAHPHQWSSQLSTVPSESEGGSARGSRSWSEPRRSSGVVSPASRGMQSNASSYQVSGSLSRSASRSGSIDRLERPSPAFLRNGQRDNSSSSIRIVDEEDEEGDVVTDMPAMLRSRPSRQRLSGFFSSSSSDDGRTNTMRSTTSSRANSLIQSSIPTWAKLYYGSGERRYLGAPGSSIEGSDSRPASAWSRSGSPDTANFPLSIYSPRRRPREDHSNGDRGSMEVNPAPIRDGSLMHTQHQWTRRLRDRTSSIWSPHLRTDRRAVRQSAWNPSGSSWSADNGKLGRRNRQIVMFIVGFIFPFSWMIAAVLPLPSNPARPAMREASNSEEELSAEDLDRTFGPIDDKHYLSAKWWRGLNRWMSLVGLLLIAAIIVLVIVGVRQGWAKS